MKEGICTAVGVVGSAIAAAFGGWDQALVTLVIFIQFSAENLVRHSRAGMNAA